MECLLSRANMLVSMGNVKTQRNLEQINELTHRVEELQKEITRLQAAVIEVDRLRTAEGQWTQEKADLFLQIHRLEKEVTAREEEIHELKGKIARRESEWATSSEAMKNDIANSYVVGFEAAMEQACITHPGVDFFEVNPCYAVVDGKVEKDI